MVRSSQLLAGASALAGAASGQIIKRQQGSLPAVRFSPMHAVDILP